MGLVVGIDTGGTFTDMVVFDPATGEVDSLKTSSTPAHAGPGDRQRARRGRRRRPPSSRRFTHGTTVGTNALIERTGCKVAFVTTKGFEDTPYIQRINRKVLYDLRWRKPEPLVASRRLCLGVEERLDSERRRGAGRSTRTRCASSARTIRDAGAEAVALCLLFSYVNTEHEERVQGDPRRGAAGRPGLRLARGGADLARVRAVVDDDRRRLPEPLFGRYVGEPRRRAARRRHDARVDDHEVERRRDARRRGRATRRSRP